MKAWDKYIHEKVLRDMYNRKVVKHNRQIRNKERARYNQWLELFSIYSHRA